MDWNTLALATRSHKPRSVATSIERVLNMYVERNPDEARSPVTLYSMPGLAPWGEFGDGPNRGLHLMGSDLYVVSGDTLYIVDTAAVQSTLELGPIDGNGAVRMENNRVHVVIATSGKLYAVNRTAGLLELPESNMNGVTYQDGYFIYTQRGTQFMWISGLDDATTISALDFTSADALEDLLVGCKSVNRRPWLLGEETIEVFDNTGDATFPFMRSPGGVIDKGCLAPGSIALEDNTLYWLGNDKRVYRAQGLQPVPVSTPDIDLRIAGASAPGSAEAFCYTQAGHTYYVLGFADLTLQLDTATGIWTDRASYEIDRWRAQSHVMLSDGTHLVGDYADGRIHELDLETYDEDGDPLIRQVVTPPVDAGAGARGGIMHEVFLAAEMGVGLDGNQQGDDPVVALDWTDDDGRTWSNVVEASLGRIGEYRNRATFTRLGEFTSRSLRFTVSDPVDATFLGAEVRAERLAA